jgi:hypothetical protein
MLKEFSWDLKRKIVRASNKKSLFSCQSNLGQGNIKGGQEKVKILSTGFACLLKKNRPPTTDGSLSSAVNNNVE